jgi:signal transduction histidine kinase
MLGTSASALVGAPFVAILSAGERERLRLLEDEQASGWNIPACRLRFARLDGAEITAEVCFGRTKGAEESLILSARNVTDVTRAEELMGKLAQLFGRGSAMLDADALLDASEPIFEELGWKVGFTQILPDGSITLRMFAPEGDPVGDYGRSIVGVRMPFDKTPVLAQVVASGRPIFLDNVPTLLPGPVRNAIALGASMERARLLRSAWCPVSSDGKLTHLLAVTGRDLTEHDFVAIQLFAAHIGAALRMSELRAELVHRERLAAVGEMAAVMAHEVRNPLGVIFNALAGLQKLENAPRGTALLGIIREEAERLRRLVTDLLDFSRPSAVECQAVALLPVMQEAVNAARQDPTSAEETRQVDIDVPPDLPKADTDPFLLRRALVNLLVNAFQGTPSGGRVALAASRAGDGELRVRVSNDGPAIPPEVAARVFEPFFTTRATGTGLGLAVVQRILGEIGGRVELDASDATSGTSFSIWLPIERRSTPRPPSR